MTNDDSHGTPIRVMMVVPAFHPIVGGAERQAQWLGVELMKDGHAAVVVTRRFAGVAGPEMVDGLRVHRLGTVGNGRNWLASLVFTVRCAWWLVRRAADYDVVHAHQARSPAHAAVLAKLFTAKPVVVKVTCGGKRGDLADLSGSVTGALRRLLLRNADRIVVLSDESFEEALQIGVAAERVLRVKNGVDTEHFAPSSGPSKQDSPTVVYVGRLVPEKGIDVLLRAWRRVIDTPQSAGYRLVLVGDGTQRQALEQLAQELGIAHRVQFVGGKHDVRRFLQQAHAFVLSSRFEGLPNALLEAMACGLPVVATEAGGVPDLVADGITGLLAPPEDVGALASALGRIVSDAGLRERLGKAARQLVVREYSLNAVARDYEALYRALLAKPDPKAN